VDGASVTPGGTLYGRDDDDNPERTLGRARLFSVAFGTGVDEDEEHDDGDQTDGGPQRKKRKKSAKKKKKKKAPTTNAPKKSSVGRPTKRKSPGRPAGDRDEELRLALYERNRKKARHGTTDFTELMSLSKVQPLKRARDVEQQDGRRVRARSSEENDDMDVDPSSTQATTHEDSAAPTLTAAEPPSDARLNHETRVQYARDLVKTLFETRRRQRSRHCRYPRVVLVKNWRSTTACGRL